MLLNPVEILVPPSNFAMVDIGLYRSGFFKKKNFPFLKRLGLKSVLFLCPEEYPKANLEFLESIDANLFQFGVQGNKEPFVEIPEEVYVAALKEILNTNNHPMLIHCNKGKHRTGCLVGCFRKVQKWSMTTIFDEYRRFAEPKPRFLDQQFIELFDCGELSELYEEYVRYKAYLIKRQKAKVKAEIAEIAPSHMISTSSQSNLSNTDIKNLIE